MDLVRDIDASLTEEYICPVSGLSCYSKPEWTDVYFDREKSDYSITVRLIGRNIMLAKVVGNSTKERFERALGLLLGVIGEHMADRPFVYVDDFTEFKSATFEARKRYINFLVGLKNLQAVVLISPSPLLKLSLKLGRRFYRPAFKTRVATSYAEAIHYACSVTVPGRGGALRNVVSGAVPMIRIPGPEASGIRDSRSDKRLRPYADELLHYLASIDWQKKGVDSALLEREADHPFKAVCDAIAYIKVDMDELFEKQQQIQQALEESEEQIHTLTQALIKAQEDERRKISRDLHDNVAQDLASLMISSETLFDGHPDIPAPIREKKAHFASVLKEAITFIRNMAYDLRPPFLDQLGLVSTLSSYCDDFSEAHHISVDFYSGGVQHLRFGFETEINLYRLVQEALSNIRKHAEARHVTVRFTASHPLLMLRIEDNGKGFDVPSRKVEALKEKRMGLKSMEERARILSGTFSLRSAPGQGTRILVEIPQEKHPCRLT
ncbi:hypothetical protein DSLASN_38970 [Desulfoluna limicola]|uniref:Histidine kinase/HSP90-like ATPase domain-containing protein n=1 Tax=Desulfoluna limicola TaxID=2810562 RepID=A0ABN6F8W2_9BACT|nr:sensor histidine kinase [Desulfoluna limicola]BCS98265.1 hypothetical protein DSLASN_38970 [Desulfoluna limicola]